MIKRYWAEILVFGSVFAVLMVCNLPNMTWINTDSDGPHYILAAKYLMPAHNTSAPLFLLLGRLFLFLPFGTEAWRMGLMSVLATTACTVLIYLVVKRQTNNRWHASIASLIYGSSALVISQSTIIESYALSTMLAVGAYYYSIKQRWTMVIVFIGLMLAVHPLWAVMVGAVLVVTHKQLRRSKYLWVTASFLLFYLYLPFSRALHDIPYMWGNTTMAGFFTANAGTMYMLAGGLSMWDLPKRILDTIAILGVSMGLGFVAWICVKWRKKEPLVWLALIPAVYFVVNLASETYVYMMPTIAFASIMVGVGLSKLHRVWAYAVGGVALALLIFNANYFDIGRTLDPNLSATKFYNEELPKIPDGEIYLGGGWTWAIVYLYNQEEGRDIVPVCTDILPSAEYRDIIRGKGINVPSWDVVYGEMTHMDWTWKTAQVIVETNDNVWLAKETNPSTYEYEIVPAEGNMELIKRWQGYELNPQIAWMPSNPYDFITGSLEVSEWTFILLARHNIRFIAIWAFFGYFVYWIGNRLWGKFRKEQALLRE
jgi:hypothetical protein